MSDNEEEAGGKWSRVVVTAVTLLILASFLGVILITAYNQISGRSTLPAQLPPIAFIQPDTQGILQIVTADPEPNASPTFLTSETSAVLEFAVSPDGTAVAYVVANGENSTLINLLDWNGRRAANHRTLLNCPAEQCVRLVWHPDGRRLAYERRTPIENTPTLWWLDTQTSETIPLFTDSTAPSEGAAFSPDGLWISFLHPQQEELILYHLTDGRQYTMRSLLNSPAVWSPDSASLLFSDYDLLVYHGDDESDHDEHSHDYDQAIHIYAAQIISSTQKPLSDVPNVDDNNAAWSPDGRWIAYGRKPLSTAAGRQLWLMQADGSDDQALTNDLIWQHGPPTWSSDGRFLLMQKFNTGEPSSQPGIWLLEVSTGAISQLQANGSRPTWLAHHP